MTVPALILVLGAIQSIFWAVAILWAARENRRPNRYLALLLFAFGCGLASLSIEDSPYAFSWPHLAATAIPLSFIYPPLFYFYLRSLTRQPIERPLIHFVPFVLCVLYFAPFTLSGAEEKIEWIRLSRSASPPSDVRILELVVLMQELTYAVLSWRSLRRHAQNLRGQFSSVERLTLDWLRHFLIALLVVTAVFFTTTLIDGLAQYWTGISITVMVFWIGLMALRQPQILFDPATESAKYTRSGLTTAQAMEYEQSLRIMMENEKPYLNGDLTLSQLAAKIQISPNHLSQVLNERIGLSFHDYVNSWRVEEAKRLLRSNGNQTILAIAFDAGFRSKSGFNAAFKRTTGQSPAEYRKQSQR
jgi:AraC-like DNA-binding protein